MPRLHPVIVTEAQRGKGRAAGAAMRVRAQHCFGLTEEIMAQQDAAMLVGPWA